MQTPPLRSRFTQDPENWDDEDLFEQLVKWQKDGKFASLHTNREGTWTLLVETDPWHARGHIDERTESMGLRFVTAPMDTPQNAIRAALKHLR